VDVRQYEKLFRAMDPPHDAPPEEGLRAGVSKELELVSRLWFESGHRAGIAAHLSLALLCELILTHDREFPHRFRSRRSLRRAFSETDRVLREVTDSGKRPTGGISAPEIRTRLSFLSDRHRRATFPKWMTTYFAFSYVESAERASPGISDDERRTHLNYMAKAFRIMGVAFSPNRSLMEEFSRQVELAHTGRSPKLERYVRDLLLLAEMLRVSSEYHRLAPLLPELPRILFRQIYPQVQPAPWKSTLARASGRFLTKGTLGERRRAVQATAWRRPALPAGDPE
jgi:hypothetical protein